MHDVVAEIRRLYDAGKYDDAVRLAEDAEQNGAVNPALLVWKSRSYLLSDHPRTDLSDVEVWLRRALEIDNDYLPALLELGFFYSRVMDNVKSAWPLFERARDVCTEHGTDTVIGVSECIAEMESPEAALNFLNKRNLLIDDLQLKKLKSELQNAAGSNNEE